MMFPKQRYTRSKRYFDWVKTLPSCVSGIEPAGDAHHIKISGHSGTVKSPDLWCIPLTRAEHTEFHQDPKAWEEKYGEQMRFALETIEKAVHAKVLRIG